MDSMRDIRTRTRSVRQSLQMTTAMKLISTSKLRKARRRLEETLPYFEAIRRTIREIILRASLDTGKWFDHRTGKANRRVATLVITADRGLAGGYNNAVIRHVEEHIPLGSVLLPVGFVGKRTFMERDYLILEDFPVSSKEPTIANARDIANFVADLFLSGKVDEFKIVYTHMLSTVKQVVEELALLPLEHKGLESQSIATRKDSPFGCLPDDEVILDLLVPKYLTGVIYGPLVDSFASEQAARMAAMESSSKNAKEMLEDLQLLYNRARQGAITAEVSEIVAGAAALGS
ncbi:MAG: ATP synthase F1 subunit gamma [Spirochaetota bacterium]